MKNSAYGQASLLQHTPKVRWQSRNLVFITILLVYTRNSIVLYCSLHSFLFWTVTFPHFFIALLFLLFSLLFTPQLPILDSNVPAFCHCSFVLIVLYCSQLFIVLLIVLHSFSFFRNYTHTLFCFFHCLIVLQASHDHCSTPLGRNFPY
jgi:hypothetical protein